ncbi:hypothetical protein [Nannocystis sp. SCPEA4]|uniref:hypothetical protein n=1 Tax=Nannocystis sp. SCPEA4 TaxID=2996787 RepID=UPI00226ED965|nr:hypothetical protein [Nannocystis sp. SCPEA4]MCY1053545.1 hypothetical protein [Nannocystis sp. SCPEA4]
MRWWQPVLTGLAGVALTLGLMLGLAVANSQPPIPPAPPEATTVSLGTEGQGFRAADVVFPLERYVLHGETQWLPLLLQLEDPEFLAGDKRACISRLHEMPEDANCRVEYSLWLDPDRRGRVLGIEALVTAGEASPCRAYVECRLPGLASAQLEVPEDVFLAHPSGLRITDKVTHATRRPSVEDEERERAELTALLAAPDPPDLLTMPPEAQRLHRFFRERKAQLLAVLQQRGQRR